MTTTIAEHVDSDTTQRSGGALSAAAGGVVAFRSASPDSRLIWFDRSGREIGAFPARADYHHPWLSPDEKRIAVEKTDPATGRHGVWILDLARGTTSRLLLDPTGAHRPIWSPDGNRIGFASNRLGGHDLYEIASDGSGGETAGVQFEGRRSGGHRLVARRTVSPLPNQAPGNVRHCWPCRSRPMENHRAFSKRPRTRSRDSFPLTSAGSPTHRTNPARRKCTFERFLTPARDGRSRCAAAPSLAGGGTGRNCSISRSTAG